MSDAMSDSAPIPHAPHADEAELSGEVMPMASGGVIRYRSWPARMYPLRFALLAVLGVAAIIGAAVALEGFFWAVAMALGLTVAGAPFVFPTEVALDGPRLNLKRLGTPRTWDLATFERIELVDDLMNRAELLTRSRLGAIDPLNGVTIPLPSSKAAAQEVVAHLRRWIGRRPTGEFQFDGDLVPEDSVAEADS